MKFRIQYVTDMVLPLRQYPRPCAPNLAIVGVRGLDPAFFSWASSHWNRIFLLAPTLPTNPPANLHAIEPKPFFCRRENVAVVAAEPHAKRWAYCGAQLCALSYAPPPEKYMRPPVRLWIHGGSTAISNIVRNGVLCVSNPHGAPGWESVWMDIPYTDPQDVEARVKRNQTPLRLEDDY